jgi:hypothetical protein
MTCLEEYDIPEEEIAAAEKLRGRSPADGRYGKKPQSKVVVPSIDDLDESTEQLLGR